MVRRRAAWPLLIFWVGLACSGRSTRSDDEEGEATGGAAALGGTNPTAGSPGGGVSGDSTGGVLTGGSSLGGNSGTMGMGGVVGGVGTSTGGTGAQTGGTAGGGVGGGGAGVGGVGGAGVGGVSGAGTFGFGCFERGSSIATPSGSVAIETLAVGDEVLAFDERTGGVVPRAVTATYVHAVSQTGRLPLSDGRVLRVTSEHPIYLAAEGRYARADEIDGKEPLVSLTTSLAREAAGAIALGVETTAGGFAAIDRPTVVYNISVDDLENYFVEGVLVHNKSGGPGVGGTGPAGCGVRTWNSAECTTHPTCLDPQNVLATTITANQPAETGTGSQHLDITLCSALTDEVRWVAVDVMLPMPVDAQLGGFAIYSETGACTGTLQAEMRLAYSTETAGWTTQCVPVSRGQTVSRFALVSADAATLLKNPRFVEACECRRVLWCTAIPNPSDCE